MYSKVIISFAIAALIGFASACDVKATSYTTEDDLVLANQIGFITEFKLKCKSEINTIPLFAEVNGINGIFPVFRVKDEYQFSWSEDKATAKTGNREVRLFDEEQFASYRKAQRAGDSPSVKPLATINVRYSGKFFGPNNLLVSTEFLILLSSIFVAYKAFQNRAKLIS